ncbi:MAG: hypothetical protein QOK71_09040, partial [Nitrososphaeraceae archaeon]|nr:hypothetical protein [Nitrososphaeraceae archaeon]
FCCFHPSRFFLVYLIENSAKSSSIDYKVACYFLLPLIKEDLAEITFDANTFSKAMKQNNQIFMFRNSSVI